MMAFKWIAFGIGLCPFWWQWGDQPQRSGTMFAFGPFRVSWRVRL